MSQASQSVYDFAGDHISVMMYANGASINNGVVDASAAIQEAIAYGIVTGRQIYFPAGVYLCNTSQSSPPWMSNTVYGAGIVNSVGVAITDSNGHMQLAVVAGTSGGTVPTWNFSGGTTMDGSVIWQDAGPTSGLILNILAPSNFNYQTSNIPYGCRIRGDGSGRTFIKTTATGLDLMAAISTVAAYPVYEIEGIQLIGPDSTHSGAASGHGLRISGTASPLVHTHDIYSRNFFATGKAGLWLDNCENFLVSQPRTDFSDIGLLLSNCDAGRVIGLNTSQCYTDGLQTRSAGDIVFIGPDVESTQVNGVTLYGANNCTFYNMHLEQNNQLGGGWGLGIIGNATYGRSTFNQFYGTGFYDLADSIMIQGYSLLYPVFGNVFFAGIQDGWSGSPINIANDFSIGNTWYGFNPAWFGGQVGAETIVTVPGIAAYIALAAGATSLPGPCCLYITANTSGSPGAIATLPQTYGGTGGVLGVSGLRCSILVTDAYTTFVNTGNVILPSGISSPFTPSQGTLYDFISFGGSWYMLPLPVPSNLKNITGNFTPTITFSSTTGTITYSLQVGTYSWTGVQVILSVQITITGIGTSSGVLEIQIPSTDSSSRTMPVTAETVNAAVYLNGFVTPLSGLVGVMGSGGTSFSIYIGSGGSGQVGSANFAGASSVTVQATFAFHE